MDCKQFEKLLGQYMDGELDAASAEAMRLHMEQCGECAQEFAVLDKIVKELAQTGDEPVPVDFEQRWKQKIQDGSTPRKKTSFGRLMPALAAGTAAVAVVSVILATGMLNPALTAPKAMNIQAAQAAPRAAAAGGAAESQASMADNAGAEQFAMMAPAASQAPEADAAQAAPAASPQMKMAVQASLAATPVLVPADTLDKLQDAFLRLDSVKIEFTRSDNHLTVVITDQNKKAVASLAKALGLELSPQTGETYDFYSAQ